eukprot:Rhum_TRINITY_DN2158_c0_g1::Rhum_TRINITY_DN2158_c0_g1_i1::g.6093::m.6093
MGTVRRKCCCSTCRYAHAARKPGNHRHVSSRVISVSTHSSACPSSKCRTLRGAASPLPPVARHSSTASNQCRVAVSHVRPYSGRRFLPAAAVVATAPPSPLPDAAPMAPSSSTAYRPNRSCAIMQADPKTMFVIAPPCNRCTNRWVASFGTWPSWHTSCVINVAPLSVAVFLLPPPAKVAGSQPPFRSKRHRSRTSRTPVSTFTAGVAHSSSSYCVGARFGCAADSFAVGAAVGRSPPPPPPSPPSPASQLASAFFRSAASLSRSRVSRLVSATRRARSSSPADGPSRRSAGLFLMTYAMCSTATNRKAYKATRSLPPRPPPRSGGIGGLLLTSCRRPLPRLQAYDYRQAASRVNEVQIL